MWPTPFASSPPSCCRTRTEQRRARVPWVGAWVRQAGDGVTPAEMAQRSRSWRGNQGVADTAGRRWPRSWRFPGRGLADPRRAGAGPRRAFAAEVPGAPRTGFPQGAEVPPWGCPEEPRAGVPSAAPRAAILVGSRVQGLEGTWVPASRSQGRSERYCNRRPRCDSTICHNCDWPERKLAAQACR